MHVLTCVSIYTIPKRAETLQASRKKNKKIGKYPKYNHRPVGKKPTGLWLIELIFYPQTWYVLIGCFSKQRFIRFTQLMQ